MAIDYRMGDIFLVDSNVWYAKLVKFLMRSPTIYHYLVGRLYQFVARKHAPLWLLRDSFYYHAGMMLNSTQLIEQQRIVEIDVISSLKNKKYCIVRRIDAKPEQLIRLASFMKADLGKGYDWLLIFGKLLTWLTGVPLFALFMNLPHKEICINRVAKAYYKEFKETWGHLPVWGSLGWSLVTTNDIYYYALSNKSYAILMP